MTLLEQWLFRIVRNCFMQVTLENQDGKGYNYIRVIVSF